MRDAFKSVFDVQRERVRKLIGSGKIDEIYDAIEKLPLSRREKIVFKALASRELVKGIVGNTAKEILQEIVESNDKNLRGSRIGFRIWTVLSQLAEKQLIQIIEGFPKLYILNREINPIPNIIYPYVLLQSLYDLLPELDNIISVSNRVGSYHKVSFLSGAYSTNEEFYKVCTEMVNMTKKEMLSTSIVAQHFDEFPVYLYTIKNALSRGVRMYCLLSNKAPPHRVRGFKDLGANVKVVNEETLREHDIPNIGIFDQRHLIVVNKYEYESGKRIRFGFWHKYNKKICAKYVKAFWKVWNS